MTRGRFGRIFAEFLLVVTIALVAAFTFARAPADRVGDEAHKVGTARFFLTLFVRHDISDAAWSDNHWTRTQTMVPRYVIGGWLWARGYDFEGLDPNYDHLRKWTTNEREGRAPDKATLTEARIPMRGLTIVSAILLYGVVRVMAGPVGGAVAALLFCGSSYLALHLVRAMAEPPLMAFLLGSLLASLVAIRQSGDQGPGVGIGILAGVLLGLAFASKLTASISMVAMLLWGVWAVAGQVDQVRARRQRPLGGQRESLSDSMTASSGRASVAPTPPHPVPAYRPLLWAAGVVAIACLVFVATNPFLYRDPIGRTVLLFQNRQQEMAEQAEADPSRAVTRLSDRVELVWTNSLIEDTWADSRLGWPLEAVLAIAGLAWLTLRAARRQPGPEALLLLWVLGYFGSVTLGLGYLLDHYFVPTATIGVILAGLTVGWSVQLAWSSTRRLSHRWRHRIAQRGGAAA